MQGTVVQSGATVGKHCILNTGASVDHECCIEDFVHISPQATLCGNVHIGEGAWIGASAVVIPGVKIGKWSIIGAGSVVVEDVPDGGLLGLTFLVDAAEIRLEEFVGLLEGNLRLAAFERVFHAGDEIFDGQVPDT